MTALAYGMNKYRQRRHDEAQKEYEKDAGWGEDAVTLASPFVGYGVGKLLQPHIKDPYVATQLPMGLAGFAGFTGALGATLHQDARHNEASDRAFMKHVARIRNGEKVPELSDQTLLDTVAGANTSRPVHRRISNLMTGRPDNGYLDMGEPVEASPLEQKLIKHLQTTPEKPFHIPLKQRLAGGDAALLAPAMQWHKRV